MSNQDSKIKFNYDPIQNPLPTGLGGVSKSPKSSPPTKDAPEALFLTTWMSICNKDEPKPKLESILRDMPDILYWMMGLIISEHHYHENKDSNTSEALEAMGVLVSFLWGETKRSKISNAKFKKAARLYDDGKLTDKAIALLKEVKS